MSNSERNKVAKAELLFDEDKLEEKVESYTTNLFAILYYS